MSKHPEHRDKGGTATNTMAQNRMIANTVWEANEWFSNRQKTCWKCQKDSRPEKGCDMKIMKGFHKYVCKACVDARKEKNDGHGSIAAS
jgi:hypothetical protein